jgi:pimeloyl-ACP methyl ester carboxylesterase
MSTRTVALFKSGVRLAMQEWGNPESPRKVLCLHGWLDNSNSFNNVAPVLAERGHHVIAYDNIGHGRSSHQSRTPPYAYPISPYVGRCRDVVEALGWKRFDMVGHSLGAFITTMFSGTYPEFVDNIALIDGFTPLSYPPSRAALALRNAIEAERSYEAKGPLGPKPYATLRDAVEARMKSVQSYPGSQWLTFEAALAIVSRAVRAISRDKNSPPTSSSSSDVKIKGLKTSLIEADPEPDITDLDFGPVAFRHDNKLLLPTNHPLTRDEVTAFVNGITARVLIVQGGNPRFLL